MQEQYKAFWQWFTDNANQFHNTIKEHDNIEEEFFNQLTPKLEDIKDGFYFLCGMFDENTAELILTADSNVKNIVFVEELMALAPELEGWKFTALKHEHDIEDMGIQMYDIKFDKETMHFYSNVLENYPDEIDLTIVHNDMTEDNADEIYNGVYIFLDNYLGELQFATLIDKITVVAPNDATEELVPMEKLKDFLIWREKEFIEKYEGTHSEIEEKFSVLQATLEGERPLIATINTELLQWDKKASHPWILTIDIEYNGQENNGLPETEDYELLNQIEDSLEGLTPENGCLYIGREAFDNSRRIYFACKSFRFPSKMAYKLQQQYSELPITYNIYKDKYWQSLKFYMQN